MYNSGVLKDKIFEKISIDNGENDWITCWVDDYFFKGACDSNKLKELIRIFKNWVED